MALEGLLLHTLEVYRRAGRTDRFGQDRQQNPRQNTAAEATAVYPCRAYQKSGGLLAEERMVDVFQRNWCVFVDAGADVREDDGIKVLDQSGRVLIGQAKIKSTSVIYDSVGPHHIEITVWEQSGPDGTVT